VVLHWKTSKIYQRINGTGNRLVIKKGRLRHFGHADWVKDCMMMEVDRTRQKGHPMKTWWDAIKDMYSGPSPRRCKQLTQVHPEKNSH